MIQGTLLPALDREATRKRVEEALETVRIYKQIGVVRREMKTTTSFEPRFHGPTNKTGDPVGDIASWNADKERELEAFVERVDKAVSRLSYLQRKIIELKYLQDEERYDFEVQQELHMSERTYRRTKAVAIYKLALMLRLEVLEGDEDDPM